MKTKKGGQKQRPLNPWWKHFPVGLSRLLVPHGADILGMYAYLFLKAENVTDGTLSENGSFNTLSCTFTQQGLANDCKSTRQRVRTFFKICKKLRLLTTERTCEDFSTVRLTPQNVIFSTQCQPETNPIDKPGLAKDQPGINHDKSVNKFSAFQEIELSKIRNQPNSNQRSAVVQPQFNQESTVDQPVLIDQDKNRERVSYELTPLAPAIAADENQNQGEAPSTASFLSVGSTPRPAAPGDEIASSAEVTQIIGVFLSLTKDQKFPPKPCGTDLHWIRKAIDGYGFQAVENYVEHYVPSWHLVRKKFKQVPQSPTLNKLFAPFVVSDLMPDMPSNPGSQRHALKKATLQKERI